MDPFLCLVGNLWAAPKTTRRIAIRPESSKGSQDVARIGLLASPFVSRSVYAVQPRHGHQLKVLRTLGRLNETVGLIPLSRPPCNGGDSTLAIRNIDPDDVACKARPPEMETPRLQRGVDVRAKGLGGSSPGRADHSRTDSCVSTTCCADRQGQPLPVPLTSMIGSVVSTKRA